ncbi:MAG: pyridoxamine 5'-phosphate oxidase [Saprospiraceae bacterium]
MNKDVNLRDLRRDYNKFELIREDLQADPIEQMRAWMSDAIEAKEDEANAMTLATVRADGRPDARIVLLKEIEEIGLVFYTNYESKKGKQMAENGFASVVFFWHNLHRQLRVSGKIEKIDAEDSDQYFHSRPLDSQIGAIVSPQSTVIQDKTELEDNFKKIKENLAPNTNIERPNHWGGYRLIPDLFEFWQGRSSRLHDRFEYQLHDGKWKIVQLAP